MSTRRYLWWMNRSAILVWIVAHGSVLITTRKSNCLFLSNSTTCSYYCFVARIIHRWGRRIYVCIYWYHVVVENALYQRHTPIVERATTIGFNFLRAPVKAGCDILWMALSGYDFRFSYLLMLSCNAWWRPVCDNSLASWFNLGYLFF